MGLPKTLQKFVYKLRRHKKQKKNENKKKLEQPGIRKVFVDADVHAGESISFYLDKTSHLKKCTVYFFEPNPEYATVLKEMENRKDYKNHL